MKRKIASRLAKYYKVPITMIYEDIEYWENSYGFAYIQFCIAIENAYEQIVKDLSKLLNNNNENKV